MVCPLRRHAAFIVCYTGPNAAASRNGNEQARRHERRESAFPLPPPRPPPAARPAPDCRSLSAGRWWRRREQVRDRDVVIEIGDEDAGRVVLGQHVDSLIL